MFQKRFVLKGAVVKKIKLMHVISHLSTGGAQILLFDLIERLQEAGGYEQVVVTFKGGNCQEKFALLGVPVFVVDAPVRVYDPVFLYRFAKLVLQEQPDCMHSVLWAANFLSRIVAWWYGIPLVQSLHNNIDQNGSVRLLLDRLFSFHKTPIVAVSDGIIKSIEAHAPWMKKQSLVVIKNGIAVQDVQKKSSLQSVARADLGLDATHFVIGSVGRFEKVKNYSLLLTAFALLYDKYPQARLVLVGYGSQEQFLKKRAFDLGIADRVVFIVNKPGYGYYPLFDCFTLSSYKEGISLALLEAMSLGCPVVITSYDREHDVVIHDYNGLIAKGNDPQALADALATVIDNPERAKGYGQQAVKTVQESFDSSAMASKYCYLYKKTMDSSVSALSSK